MYLPRLSISALTLLSIFAQSAKAAPISKQDASSLNQCTNLNTVFAEDMGGWTEETGITSGWSRIDSGLELVLEPPQDFIRLTNSSDNGNDDAFFFLVVILTCTIGNPYNEYSSPKAPNFIASQLLHYGKVTYVLKTSGVAGAVTAAILMVPGGGDEIDFEMLGGDRNRVQTNYFYAGGIVYGVNGGNSDAEDTAADFHSYTIDWYVIIVNDLPDINLTVIYRSPERIQWLVDGKIIRTTSKSETCKDNGVCSYPSHPT